MGETTMNQRLQFGVFLLLFLLLVPTSILCANLLEAREVPKENINEIITGESPKDAVVGESMNKLMGMENCDKGNEECLERREVEEAHLDYIYTQSHRP